MPLGILPWGNGDSAFVLHGTILFISPILMAMENPISGR